MKRLAILLAPLALAACDPDNSGAAKETRQTMQVQDQLAQTIGMPAIINGTEKRQLKTIYELRDQANLITYTYTIDLAGKRHKVCPSTSMGFGIPYATQYTAPKALKYQKPQYPVGSGYDGSSSVWTAHDFEQPEPNGLYMPASADGTWVICLAPNGKDLAPTYVEPRVVVYLFEMPSVD